MGGIRLSSGVRSTYDVFMEYINSAMALCKVSGVVEYAGGASSMVRCFTKAPESLLIGLGYKRHSLTFGTYPLNIRVSASSAPTHPRSDPRATNQ